MRQAVIASTFFGFAAIGLLTGCPDRSISKIIPQQGRVEYKDIPITVNRNIDILFLIDDSPSMADKQANLAANFPNFINVLNTVQGGLPDVHIGVATSDLGAKGADDASPGPAIGSLGQGGCSGTGKNGNLQITGAPVTGTFISDIKQTDGSRAKNYTGNLTDVFATMAKVGAGGCGFEQHLQGVKNALNNNAANQGFLRADAYLAVIIIADEDDCSMAHSTLLGPETPAIGVLASFRCTRFGVICDVGGGTPDAMNQVGTKDMCHPNDASPYLTNVADYATFLKGLKPDDPSKVIVAGIIGPTSPFQTELRPPPNGGTPVPSLAHSCMYTGGDGSTEYADPATRIKFFLDQFPNRSTFDTICQMDLTGALQQIADLLKTVLGDPCIEGKIADADLATPGIQYDCSVSYVTNQGKPNQTEDILPECDAGMTMEPCWHLIADTMNCPNSDHLKLKIESPTSPPPETHEIAYCVTESQCNGNGTCDPGETKQACPADNCM